MILIIDLILALFGVIIIIVHTAKGFIRSLFGFLKLVFAVCAAWILTPVFFSGSDIAGKLLGYVIVFSATYAVTALIALLFDKLFKLPVLNATNKFLGFLLGIVCAYILLSAASTILYVIVNFIGETSWGISGEMFTENSYVYRFFSEYGVFNLIDKII